MGINDSRLVRNAYVDQVTVFVDQTHNKSRRLRYKILRSRLANKVPISFKEPNRRVYIRRGRTGERRILENENQIESFLQKNGFSIIDAESLSAEEIAFRTYNAKIVVGVEGSHLSHAQYSIADKGIFLVIQPPDRFSMVYKEFADCLGMKFAFVVGELTDNGFVLPLKNIQKILDLLY